MENSYDTYHYAPAIQVGDTVYLSGQVGRDENLIVVEGTEAQFIQAFENVEKVLDAAGATFDDVVEHETWFTDSMADLKTFLAAKDRNFTNRCPTWTGFAIKGFSMPGILVEIKCKDAWSVGRMKRLGDFLSGDARSFGTWAQIPAPEVFGMIGFNGFDLIVLDCRHAPLGIETAERTARGACPCVRSGGHFVRDWRDYAAPEKAESGVTPLVENGEGIAEIEAIAATPGLSALMAEPFDLSVNLGLHGNWRDDRVDDALRRLVGTARDRGIAATIPVFLPDPSECPELVEHWAEAGVTSFVIGSDKIMIANAFHNRIENMSEKGPSLTGS